MHNNTSYRSIQGDWKVAQIGTDNSRIEHLNKLSSNLNLIHARTKPSFQATSGRKRSFTNCLSSWIDQDQFKYSKVCNNSVTKHFSHCKYGYPRVQVCRIAIQYMHGHHLCLAHLPYHVVHYSNFIKRRISLSMVGLLGRT